MEKDLAELDAASQHRFEALQQGIAELRGMIVTKFDNLVTLIDKKTVAPIPLPSSSSSLSGDSSPFSPLTTHEELLAFDKNLSQGDFKANLMSHCDTLWNGTKERSNTLIHLLLNKLISKELLNQCSWGGGSRGAKKTGLKHLTGFLEFFQTAIHRYDSSFSGSQCEAFLKKVTKNSKSRLTTGDSRKSSSRSFAPRRRREANEHDAGDNENAGQGEDGEDGEDGNGSDHSSQT